MVDAMRAMLDELMGEDRDGDRQKCVSPHQLFGRGSPELQTLRNANLLSP